MPRFIIKPVVWNQDGYTKPSGVTVTSGFAKKHGYGHEEWNNSPKLVLRDKGAQTRIFHTETVGGLEETNGANVVFMVASHGGKQCLVSVAGRATGLFDDAGERERLAGRLKIRGFWEEAWSVAKVRKAFGTRERFKEHWDKHYSWVPTWKCPADCYLALKAPVPLNASKLTGKRKFITMYSSHQNIDAAIAAAILDLIPSTENGDVLRRLQILCGGVAASWSDKEQERVEDIANLEAEPDQTTREALIQARLGQGKFRTQLSQIWDGECAVTGCGITKMLRASHVKPWRESDNRERLDPHNGLLLTANLDALFDCGLISFAADGQMMISKQISAIERGGLGLGQSLRQRPSPKLAKYLRHHRGAKGVDLES